MFFFLIFHLFFAENINARIKCPLSTPITFLEQPIAMSIRTISFLCKKEKSALLLTELAEVPPCDTKAACSRVHCFLAFGLFPFCS